MIRSPLGEKPSLPPANSWSMLSSPAHKSSITLSVDVAPAGIGSQWLRTLKVGDPVSFKGPSGAFVFNRADPRRALFIAEEIGIVPIHSILSHLYETGYGRGNGLIFWGRSQAHLLYDAHFRSLARRYPGFSYLPAVREAEVGWRGERGEVTDAVERLVHSVDRLVVYVCGGGETIQKVRDVLVRKGMDRKSVKWEKFW